VNRFHPGLCLLVAAALVVPACERRAGEAGGAIRDGRATRAVQDMRGRTVRLPSRLSRVATIDDGVVEAVMTRLGTIRTLAAVGSSSQQRVWSYAYPTADGREFQLDEGMGTMRTLHPWMTTLPCASRTSGDAINYETIAGARPDVVILRVGDCTVGTAPDAVARTVGVLESMGLPVVVLRSPTDYRGAGLETLREEILVLGRVFDKESEAAALADELSADERFVRNRVSAVPDGDRPRALLLGLAARARTSGGAAYVWGRETAESWMLEAVVGARNAYTGAGARVLLNAEQILALDPDVIFLPTASGYHPPRELAEAPCFRELQRLRAVRQHRVYALPWSPMNCAMRLEYPIDLMIIAKGAYPNRFPDVALSDWILQFYRRTYHVPEDQARALRRGQWLEWTAEARF
jgi:iron complex transport system substrate-binding protein